MEGIKMVDLNGQYNNIKAEVDAAIQEVINSSAFINGPDGSSFTALQGDEVILPDFTFIATAEVVALLQLKPVFVDVDPDTFLIDTDKLKSAITKNTKAIIPVHLYGQCANMAEIVRIARENNITVIEDNAQAIGADIKIDDQWKKAGIVGNVGCTSFFPSKNLGCFGDGGAIFTNDDRLGEELACIANHGAKVKYYHDSVGVNSRLDTLQAAILSVKLQKLDEYIKARQEAAKQYDSLLKDLPDIKLPERVDYSTHVFHQYTLKVKKRDELKNFLSGKGIPSMIYYPVGMHNQIPYKMEGDFKVSDELCNSVLSLPMHTELTFGQQEYITDAIKEFYLKK